MSRKWLWLLLPALVLVGAAVWFGFRFVTRLAEYPRVADTLPAELSAARRDGLPLSPADLRPSPPVPPSQNAAPIYRQIDVAFRARQSLADADGETAAAALRRSATEADKQKVRAALARWEPQMRLAETAAGRTGCDFARRWELGPELEYTEFPSMRRLARFFAVRALLDSDAGRPDAAFRSIAVGAKIGRHAATDPTAIGLLMQIAIGAIMNREFQRVVVANKNRPDILRLASQATRAFGPPPDLRHALRGEVVMGRVAVDMIPRGGPSAKRVSSGRRLGEKWAADAFDARLLSDWRQAFAALKADQTNLPAAYRALKTLDEQQAAHDQEPTYEVNGIVIPVFSRLVLKVMHGEEFARLRQTLLALVAFRQKTGGYPSALAALPSPVPPDIFTGRPPRYRKTSDGFLLYSVGEDGRDDGGKTHSEERGKGAPDIVVSDPAI